MMIRLVLGFAALIYLAIIQPGSAQSGRLEEQLAQSTPITPTVLAVVRNQGATLHDRPNGEPLQTIVGGSLVTARLRSTDLLWVLVQTRDQSEGWVEVRTLLAAGLGRLPVEIPTPTPTLTPPPTLSPTPSPTPTPTSEAVATEVPEATPTPMSEPTPEGEMTAMPEASATPEAMEESTPQPTEEAMPEVTSEAGAPEATPTPFMPPEGPTALSLARIGGAVLWDGEDGSYVEHFRAGSRLTAAFRTDDSSWYYVYHDEGPHGWVSADELLVVSGQILTVKEFTIPLEEITPVEVGETAPGTGTPTPTPTPAGPPERVTVTVIDFGLRLNVRAGPSTDYDIVAKAVAGVTFNGIGRTESGDWVQVAIADLPSGYGWVSATYVTTTGPFDELPVVGEMEMEEKMEMDAEKEENMVSAG
ncbi:MAG: SH3 domain-containing protein [Caldilineaceae bacterium SB0675_bin_29]|uniref:SH3 domain-containing protein n=1 Tax=Caldilineaceae bacterium SB0675_bin_29 TaxID=2605266 RepID=A0A6B1FWP5_9CHLR|nr:SH3 domain-containing protein [Caldilineaceae bacterium SB0675_bin_29]